MNLIGLSLLLVVSLCAFLSLLDKYFIKLGLSAILVFLFLLAFVFGTITPTISLWGRARMSVGGFIVPIIFAFVVLFATKIKKEKFKLFLSVLAITTITIATRVLVLSFTAVPLIIWVVTSAILCGFAAFLINASRGGILFSATFGIVLGNVFSSLILYFSQDMFFTLGTDGAFDAIIAASIFASVIFELSAFRKEKIQKKEILIKEAFLEAAEDSNLSVSSDEYKKYFE